MKKKIIILCFLSLFCLISSNYAEEVYPEYYEQLRELFPESYGYTMKAYPVKYVYYYT